MAAKQAKYIKIPRDFKSLGDLKELMQHYELICELHDELGKYKDYFVKSFLMDMDEVLAYISPSELDQYSLRMGAEKVTRCGPLLVDNMSLINVKGLKMYMVDTANKSVDLHPWVSKKIDIGKLSYFKWEKTRYLESITVTVSKDEGQVLLRSSYSFPTQRREGGVKIYTYGEKYYMSGGTMVDSTGFAGNTYAFCTKTNTYLGFKETEYDE